MTTAPAPDTLLTRWRADPVTFCTQQWGPTLWEAQEVLMRAAWTSPRLAVKAGHGVGKSYAVSRLALAFLVAYPGSKVLTTAPTWTQVEKILWSEIRHAVGTMKVTPGGVLLTTEYRMGEHWFALGISTDEVERLQGFHAPHILVIFDEASGVPAPLWEAADSLLVGAHSRWVVVGNPLDPTGPFHACFQPKSGWATLTISSEDSPNVVLGEERIPGLVGRAWVEQKRQEWGEDSMLYASRVKGEFPVQALARVIHPAWVRQCVRRAGVPDVGRRMVSADIADFGTADTVLYGWEGWTLTRESRYAQVAAMETAANLVAFADALQADTIVLDATGMGAPVVERVQELLGSRPVQVVGVNFAAKATRPECRNMRAELWLTAAEVLRQGQVCLPADPLLEADLCAAVYDLRQGKLILQEKAEIMRELGRSPDRGDACVLGLWGLATLDPSETRDPWRTTSTTAEAIQRREDEARRGLEEVPVGAYGEPG